MCTAVGYKTRDFYFGRTLDYDVSFSEEITFTPRNFPLPFCHRVRMDTHYAILGMAQVRDGYPLYFDGINEKGLAMAGLNFVGNARYPHPLAGKENIASFELIPWILGQCATVAETEELLKGLNLTDTAFREDIPPAQLHWIIADRSGAVTLEAVREGLRVYDNPVGVLTNNPTFPEQMMQLNHYMNLSPEEPENRFSKDLDLRQYSRGMGAIGLPGDLSSQSRFVRAAFTKLNSISGDSESESVSQFFHILGSVSQTRGCCRLGQGRNEFTQYASCCNADKGIYYYKTYDNHCITAVDMHREDLDDSKLVCYPLVRNREFPFQNG